tara:strand:- start:1170 stop:1829 length:660 start_codon:yes stop_codon:yes gene_type:complete
MTMEINLLDRYPKTNRDPSKRAQAKTEGHRAVARLFEKDFFDGDRSVGYGGYSYRPDFWSGVVQTFAEQYNLKAGDKVLDAGCAKGYMLYDLTQEVPGIEAHGIDVSNWAIENCHPEVRDCLSVRDVRNLDVFDDDEFDLVISINTVHNLVKEECAACVRELDRISKNCFLTVDSWVNEEGEKSMRDWNLTAQTMMSVDNWKVFLAEAGYAGDYYWFFP